MNNAMDKTRANGGVVISSASDIDLNRHGVIEAHAGTGKTYTIVNLILRMLERSAGGGDGRFIHLRDIMLVTYTEKAAGELKKRIQDGISQRIREMAVSCGQESGACPRPKQNQGLALALHLENCLNNMHEALIGTIHSVCLRLLQTWPFETGVHFSTNIADDGEGISLCLRESMRSDWQNDATGIPRMLVALEEGGVGISEKKHLALIKTAALALLGGDGVEFGSGENDDPVHTFIRRAAELLAKRYGAYKRVNGLVSYSDMLRLTHDAVHVPNSVMLKTLRARLRYGIIDEFQDTSPVQWSVFKKIFLDTDAAMQNSVAKIYIVGDPKQSIYSFQNADVRSYIAAKDAIAKLGGSVYSLIANYRSLPQMIDGYNAILDSQNCDGGEDWFLYGDGGEIAYPRATRARAPKRALPPRPLACKAIQIIAADDGGKAAENRSGMASAACAAIKKLKGTVISIPKGTGYEDITLDYRDFAVIVESHQMADPFIEAFRANGIPCMKYKLSGVFNSAIARDLRAVLSAVHKRHFAPLGAAMLLTHFFNRPPETIDPKTALAPCPDINCKGDGLCAAHALDHWGMLADRQLWAQLFESVTERTEIKKRLIRLADGERKLADLRQVTDYCVEYLYRRTSDLGGLIDHLERLYENEEQAGGDKNIHALSTEKSSVSILTMHASKGLEFPVAFIMNRTSERLPNGPNILPWTDDGGRRLFTPYLSTAAEKERLEEAAASYKLNQKRERRRLLYVAMTRPQAILFVPLDKKDKDLAPRLKRLLENGDPSAELFDKEKFCGGAAAIEGALDGSGTRPLRLDDIPELSLRELITKETSYSQMSKAANDRMAACAKVFDARDVKYAPALPADYSEEPKDDEHHADGKTQPLKGGRHTGNALHGALEEILNAEDIRALTDDGERINGIVGKYLKRGGVLEGLSDDGVSTAIEQASAYIRAALTAPLVLPTASSARIVIADIPQKDRIPESEFLMACRPHRIRGFMDLVFRVKNDDASANGKHSYTYYVIDWKSDTLDSYDPDSIEKHCLEKNYLLQAQVYSAALDKYLQGILGGGYDPKINLGGAIYVFLRGGEGACWYKQASPEEDKAVVMKYVE